MDLDYYFDEETCEMVAIEPDVSPITNAERSSIVNHIKTAHHKPSVAELTKRVSAITGVDVDDILSNRRHREVTYARYAIWYALRARYKFSLVQIGQKFGRDHNTVIYGICLAKDMMKNRHRDPMFCDTIDTLLKFIDDAACRRG